jgi:glycerophosphoryl diester phosphodiesterase
VRELKDAGLKVFVYTVNSNDDLAFVKSAGVDGVFTDFPDRIR